MATLYGIGAQGLFLRFLSISSLLSLLFVAGSSLLHAQPNVRPAIPRTGKILNDFIPAGWHLFDSTSGDLNKDKLSDLAVVIEADEKDMETADGETNEEDVDDDWEGPPRILLVLFKQKKGGYRLSARADSLVLKKGEGGMLGDPWTGMGVDRGSLTMHYYGGSAWRWGLDYRFRFQDGDWYLIGATTINYHSSSGEMESYDFNLLTGDVEITTGNMFGEECRACENCKECEPCDHCGECEHCVPVEDQITRKNIGKKKLRRLENFVPMNWEILPGNFI